MADQMKKEWEAWQTVVAALHKIGVEINDQKGLAASLTAWGEELAKLRIEQVNK